MVMTLKNGKVETIPRERDFAYLVEEYMGHEAADFYLSLVEDRDDLRADRNRLWDENDVLRDRLSISEGLGGGGEYDE